MLVVLGVSTPHRGRRNAPLLGQREQVVQRRSTLCQRSEPQLLIIRWCRDRELNPDELALTAPSKQRVYHFTTSARTLDVSGLGQHSQPQTLRGDWVNTTTPLTRVRELCLAFPGALEDATGVGNPSFKVAGNIFVLHAVNHHGDGKTAFWCKGREGAQLALTSSDPERYFVPPYVGRHGWIGVRLDRPVDWVEV